MEILLRISFQFNCFKSKILIYIYIVIKILHVQILHIDWCHTFVFKTGTSGLATPLRAESSLALYSFLNFFF